MPFDKRATVWTLRHLDGRKIVGTIVFLINQHVEAQIPSDRVGELSRVPEQPSYSPGTRRTIQSRLEDIEDTPPCPLARTSGTLSE